MTLAELYDDVAVKNHRNELKEVRAVIAAWLDGGPVDPHDAHFIGMLLP